MANRNGYEEEPGRWQEGRRDERRRERGRDAGVDPQTGMRRGGHYGIGGPERGYNMGGYGGMSSHQEGYPHRSYDRLLERSERRDVSRDDYGRDRDEDERYWHERHWGSAQGGAGYGAGAVGMGREPFGDEWMNIEQPGAMEWRARGPGQGKAPKGYTRADARIREDICERLMYSPYDASDVEISVTDGEVTLAGTVRTRADKWGIEDVAEAVLGVHDVHNQIRIIRSEAQASDVSSGGTGGLHS